MPLFSLQTLMRTAISSAVVALPLLATAMPDGAPQAAAVSPAASTPAAARPDPADPRAPIAPRMRARTAVPAPSEASVTDPGIGDWRGANQRVRDGGGWRTLAKDGASPPSAATPAAASASAPASGPAHHHHTH